MLLMVCAVLLSGSGTAWAAAAGQEYPVKAAFLYNFMRFVDWPKERMEPEDGPLVIGVIGKDPFGKALDVLTRETVRGRAIKIRRFASMGVVTPDEEGHHPELSDIKTCHLLFVATSEKAYQKRLLPALTEAAVLTVGETEGFLQAGGMINFVTQGTKSRFEIHLNHVRQARLEVRAKLLRLAKDVIEK